MEKLDNIESVYRKAIMSNPLSDPSPLQSQESQLIRNVVLLPTLSELTYLTSGGSRNDSSSPSFVDAAWNLPKDLIPALSSAPEQGEEAISKVRDVYWWLTESSSATSLEAMKALLLTHPYLFWRVPTDLYRRTLALISDNEAGSGKKIFSQDVLDALETLCDDASLWPAHVSQPSGINTALVQKMTGTLNPQENKKSLYTTHRLIMAGQHDISSPSVDFLSRLLGADETRHRVKTVQDLVKQLRDGGDELRKEWLSDAWEKYPDFMQAAAAAK
jgi:glutamyl-tRNA synthetase